MDRDWEAPLGDLRHHWGSAYLIHYLQQAGKWVAQRRDSRATMSADTAAGLRALIVADYDARPVPREAAPGGEPGGPEAVGA